MNLSLFETFVKVVETRNLSRAAEELSLSQPAVSKQIQSLEEQYGLLLLERSGRRLRPTEAGEVLYQHAREILKELEKTRKAMAEMSDTGRGNLFLGASSIPGQYLLPGMIKRFKEVHPQINIYLEVSDTEKIAARVVSRDLDIGVIGAPVANRKVDSFAWVEDELVVALPPGHPLSSRRSLSPIELKDEPWVFREKGSGTRLLAEEVLAEAGLKREALEVVAELGSSEAVLAAVESGMGVALVSRWAGDRAKCSGRIITVPVESSASKRYFYVIYPRQKSRRPAVQEFIRFIQEAEKGKELEQ